METAIHFISSYLIKYKFHFLEIKQEGEREKSALVYQELRLHMI